MHNSFILQQYVCYTTILNTFRAARFLSSGGQIVSLFTEGDDTRGCGDTIFPPEDE